MNTRIATMSLIAIAFLTIVIGYLSNIYTANKYFEPLSSLYGGGVYGCNVTYAFPFVVRLREYAAYGPHRNDGIDADFYDSGTLTDEVRISFFGYLFDGDKVKMKLDCDYLNMDLTLWKNEVGFKFPWQ
jgi:hypothetical protein